MTDLEKEINEKYKISVIVPVFRVEKYLKRCVDSIINQTYKNLEIILVDDGSDDGCPEICDNYKDIDDRIVVIHQKNGGLSSARNTGLKAATGNIISVIDSDDYINCNMFSDLIRQMDAQNADIAMCDFKYVYDNDEDIDINEKAHKARVKCVDGKTAQYYSYKDDFSRIVYNVAWNKIYKRELFMGITYPVGRIHEDEARTHQLLYRASKIVYVRYPYYYYFQRNDSIVGKSISRSNLQLLDAYIDKLKFFRKNKEYELWKLEASHSMHMVCYQQTLFDNDNIKISIINESQGIKLTEELEKSVRIKGLSMTLGLEIMLFRYCFYLYYAIWKRRKG